HTNSQIHSANTQTEINSRLDTHSSPRVVPLESSVTKTKSSCILKMLLFVILLTLTLQPALSKPSLRKPALSKPGLGCVKKGDLKQYETFLKHHLNNNIPGDLEISAWETFIGTENTWGRKTQSFFREAAHDHAKAVCSKGGKKYPGRNLCISNEPLEFITVHVDTANKKVTEVKQMNRHVILACEKIENECKPVHFEPNKNEAKPENNQPDCSG
ncbi:hypothetical protein PO909_028500, partial [Leuciscus waleckii]